MRHATAAAKRWISRGRDPQLRRVDDVNTTLRCVNRCLIDTGGLRVLRRSWQALRATGGKEHCRPGSAGWTVMERHILRLSGIGGGLEVRAGSACDGRSCGVVGVPSSAGAGCGVSFAYFVRDGPSGGSAFVEVSGCRIVLFTWYAPARRAGRGAVRRFNVGQG